MDLEFEFFAIIQETSMDEFFAIIQETSMDELRLPDKFARLCEEDGREPRQVKLREVDDEPHNLWDVEVVFKDGHIYLGRGWKPFACSYLLKFGHFPVFSYDGVDELAVKVFDISMCRRHYHYDNPNPDICLDKFFVIILEPSSDNLRLPKKFVEMLENSEPRLMKLREVDDEPRNVWDVEVVLKDDHMYLRRGWERFARSYSLQLRQLLVFSYDGTNDLTVKVFDLDMCRMHYCYNPNSDSVLDKFCVFPYRVHLNEGQKAALKVFCAENKPETPFYVCRMQKAHLTDFKGKMCFHKEYTKNYLRRLTKKGTNVMVCYKEETANVRMKIGDDGKQAIMTSKWLSVTRGLNFEVGDLAMFWFQNFPYGDDGVMNLTVEKI